MGHEEVPPPGDADFIERARPATNGATRASVPALVAPAPWPTAGDYLARMGPIGPRLSTSFATLDRDTRGGIPAGRRVVLVGAPGGCKTMVATLWAYLWEMAGAAVVYLAADDGPEGIAMRLGQLTGYTREALEADDDAARKGAATQLAGRRILLLDGEVASLEDAIGALGPAADDRQQVLIVDSLQTARCLEANGIESIRERVSTMMAVLRRPARAGAIVVGISEMARGGYKSGDRTQETSALAAAKESGAIEYAADLLLGLRSVRDEVGQFEVELAKNRLGRTPPGDERIRLRLDFASARLSEIAAPDPQAAAREAEMARLTRAKDRVRKAVLANDLRSANAVAMAAGGKKCDTLTALREMTEAGEDIKLSNGALGLRPRGTS
jgi:KaiC/GvpD/RAD55 family RecA-like ATPase